MILVKVGTPQTELGVSARGRKAPQEPGEGKRSGSRSQGWICWSLAGALQSQPFPCPLGPGCPCSSPAPGFPADSPGRCSRASPCGAGAGAGAGQRIPGLGRCREQLGRAGSGSPRARLSPDTSCEKAEPHHDNPRLFSAMTLASFASKQGCVGSGAGLI